MTRPLRIALVAEFPPPDAGMPLQARLLCDRLERDGVQVLAVRSNPSVPAPVRPLRGIRGALRWARFLAACRAIRRADAVHVFACSGLSFWLYALPPVLLGRRWRRAVILHYHGGGAARFLRRWGPAVRAVLRRADRVVVPSGYLREVFAGVGVDAEVISNPAEVGRYRFGDAAARPPVVLSCRNLYAVYDVATALRAFAVLRQAVPEARLLVAGDGPERPALQRLAARLGIQAAVTFLGQVPNERMPELFARARVLLNTPRVDNLPGSVIEAFAAGVPVVSTAAGGVSWLVRDGETGLLAPVGEYRTLGRHLVRLMREPDTVRRLAAAAHAEIGRFDWRRIGPRWRALYERLRPRAA